MSKFFIGNAEVTDHQPDADMMVINLKDNVQVTIERDPNGEVHILILSDGKEGRFILGEGKVYP